MNRFVQKISINKYFYRSWDELLIAIIKIYLHISRPSGTKMPSYTCTGVLVFKSSKYVSGWCISPLLFAISRWWINQNEQTFFLMFVEKFSMFTYVFLIWRGSVEEKTILRRGKLFLVFLVRTNAGQGKLALYWPLISQEFPTF